MDGGMDVLDMVVGIESVGGTSICNTIALLELLFFHATYQLTSLLE
jgi:hypothetical protein